MRTSESYLPAYILGVPEPCLIYGLRTRSEEW